MTSSRAHDFAAVFALVSSTVGGCVIERGTLAAESVDAFSPFDTTSDVRITDDVRVPLDVSRDAGPDAHIVPSTDLIAHWEFTNMATYLRDSSGNGHDLTVLGAGSPGARSSSLELEFGNSPGLSTPNAADFDSAVAVSLWVNAGGVPRTFECVRGDARVQSDYQLAGGWVHVACVEGDGSLDLYINGVFVRDSMLAADLPGASGYFLGATPGGTSGAFVALGRMDDVRIWGIAPTAEEITALVTSTMH